ncbi:hypothetical protein, conserved [Leishmania tarentolae]|uniref:Pentacotripeptide-repeat region of PRORP domain-containing protein n=1 Tax=Leishmania tarentolae TaxID=5689 RepID=A0A640KJ81_LEITA|nr:hypothetical protein, conserved [Leishmania tarentolae]
MQHQSTDILAVMGRSGVPRSRCSLSVLFAYTGGGGGGRSTAFLVVPSPLSFSRILLASCRNYPAFCTSLHLLRVHLLFSRFASAFPLPAPFPYGFLGSLRRGSPATVQLGDSAFPLLSFCRAVGRSPTLLAGGSTAIRKGVRLHKSVNRIAVWYAKSRQPSVPGCFLPPLGTFRLLMHPIRSGQGLFPRYGGGWMHQFGHVYALQQELLNPNANNWFRAVELWHTARQEGVAMNVSHFTSILRQCVQPGAWAQSLQVLRQMKRENVRPDVVGVGCALAACVEGKHYDEVENIFATFHKTMLLDSVCHLALIRARQESGYPRGAIAAGKQQQVDQVPFLPYTYTHLLEACNAEDDAVYAMELIHNMHSDQWTPTQRAMRAVEDLGRRHGELAEFSRSLLSTSDKADSVLLSLDVSKRLPPPKS